MTWFPLITTLPFHVETLKKMLDGISNRIADGNATEKDLDDFMLFSPFALEDVDEEVIMLGAAALGLHLSKSPEGMKLLDTLAKQYFGTIADVVSSVAKGGSTHLLSSLTGQMIVTRMMRRLGLISNQEANQIQHELAWTINKVIMKDMVKDISHAVGTVFAGTAKALVGTAGAAGR